LARKGCGSGEWRVDGEPRLALAVARTLTRTRLACMACTAPAGGRAGRAARPQRLRPWLLAGSSSPLVEMPRVDVREDGMSSGCVVNQIEITCAGGMAV